MATVSRSLGLAVALWTSALALSSAPPATAWTPKTQVAIAEEAVKILPPDLRRQLARRMADLRRGALAPFEDGEPARHVKNESGGGVLDRVILDETARAIEAIRGHRTFADIAYQMGVVSHYVADANNPLGTSDRDPAEGSYFADYLRYVESVQERFSVVFYGEGRDLASPEELPALVERTLERGRTLYPSVGAEYARIDGGSGLELFDDRSAAFGVGSLAFSHAVSDVAAVLRYVWVEAGGADPRPLPVQ